MEKEVKISREFSFILDDEGKTEEIRHYRNEKLVARYGSVYDENGNVIGVRQLRVEDVAPLSLMEKVRKSIWKKPEKLDYLNWIGVINFIGTINTINKIKTIETIGKIESINPTESQKSLWTGLIEVDTETAIKMVELAGSGNTEYVLFYVSAGTDSQKTYIVVSCDGNEAFNENFKSLNDYGFTPSTPRISLLKYTVDEICLSLLTLPFNFRKNLTIKMQAVTTAKYCFVDGLVNFA